MARTSKALQPLDLEVVAILNEHLDRAGLTRREMVAGSGLSLNRIGIILRGEQPPATIGEVNALARLAGLSASDVIGMAEDRVVARDGFALAASDTDIDAEVEAQQNEP